MTPETNILLLFQMADSGFPVGGFAYSHGLESAVKHGFFDKQEALRAYLITYAEQLFTFDFAFVASAYSALGHDPHANFLHTMVHEYEAMLMNPPIQKANCVIGRNWIRICKQLSDSQPMDKLENSFAERQLHFEFPIVYGCSMHLLQQNLHHTLHLFFYMSIRDQISAMIRLGVAGPSRAHQELHFLTEKFGSRIMQYTPVHYHKAYKTAYLLEIAQLKHEQVYSKLFQN